MIFIIFSTMRCSAPSKRLIAAILPLFFIACNQAPVESEPTEIKLVGGPQWILTAIESSQIVADSITRTDYRIGFMQNGKIWLNLACNSEIYAPFYLVDSAVAVTGLGSGKIRCIDDPYSEELLKQLGDTVRYRINADTLRLIGKDATLRFNANLLGIPWIVPDLNLSCGDTAATDQCVFDFSVDTAALSLEFKTWFHMRATDRVVKEMRLVKLLPGVFQDSIMILNLPWRPFGLVHVTEISKGTFEQARWKGVVEGASYATASFSIYPPSSGNTTVFGNFRFMDGTYSLDPTSVNGIFLLTWFDDTAWLPD